MAASKIKGINIKIGADTQGLDTALQGIEKAGRNTRTELREVDRALKDAPKSAEMWKQKQELLTQAIKDSRDKVELLADAQEQVAQQLKDGKISPEQYRAFQRELEKAKTETENFEKQLNELGDSAEDAGEKAERSSDGFTVMKGALADLAAEGVRKAVDGLKEVTQLAMDFDDAMAKVSTIADGSVPIEKLEEDIKSLSDETGIEAKQIAENVYNAISAGQKTGDAVNFVGKAAELSRAGFADSANALDILTTVMNAYGMEAEEVSRVSDVLIQTQNLGKTTVGELSSSMGKIIPTANAQKVSLEQLAAGYAIMTANGIATAETTTYMNSMLNELGKGSTTVSKLLKEETGKSFGELSEEGWSLSDVLALISEKAAASGQSFSDIWSSSEAGKAALVLLGDGAKTFNTALSQMEASAGSTETALEKLNTESYQLEKAQNKLKNAGIEAGKKVMEAITPLIDKAIPKLNNSVDWVVENLPKMISFLGKAKPIAVETGAAFAAWKVADIVKKATTAVSAFAAALAANPAGLALAGVTALTVGITALTSAHKEEETALDRSIEKYKDQIKAIEDADGKINDLKKSFDDQASAVDDECDRLQSLKDELDDLTDASGNVKEADRLRAEYITGELNDALGLEMELTNDQIIGYQNLSKEIDNLIAKRRFESTMSAYYANSAEMAEQKSNLKKSYLEMDAAFQKEDEGYQAALAEFDALQKNAGEDAQWNTNASWEDVVAAEDKAGGTEWFPQEIKDAADKIQQLRSDRALAMSERNEAERAFQSVVEWEQRGVEAEKLASSGDYSRAVDAIYQNKDENQRILEDITATEEQRLAAYKETQKKITSELNLALETREKMGIESAQREADEAFRSMEESVTAGLKAGVDATEIMTGDMRATIKKMLDSGFDINGLARWMSKTGIKLTDVFEDDYFDVVQKQFNQGYKVEGLLAWGQATDASLFRDFDEDFLKKVQGQLDLGFDAAALLNWAEETGRSMGDLLGMSVSERMSEYTRWLYEQNPILSQTSTRWGNSDRIEMTRDGSGGIYVRPEDVERYIGMGFQPRYATGGYIPSGSSGIVAEAGPELIQVMNGGIKVTPLTENTRNTAVSSESGSQKIFYNTYNINNPKIINGMDVRRLAESLASEQRRIETGRGE